MKSQELIKAKLQRLEDKQEKILKGIGLIIQEGDSIIDQAVVIENINTEINTLKWVLE